MKRKIYIENMPLEKATALFEQRLEEADCYHIKAEEITVSNSLGRITASPVYARRSSPHYISSQWMESL
jgi:putative molybdopterin biosynthesis protein